MDAIREAEGRVLNAVWASVHLFEETVTWEKPGRLTLQFDEIEPLTFRCASDGETLVIERANPEPFDMQEWGQFVVADFSARTPWSGVVSSRLVHVERLFSDYFEKPGEVGLELVFDNERTVFLLNLGDDLKVFDSLSQVAAMEEKLRCAKLF